LPKILGVILAVVILAAAAAWLRLRGPDIPYETLEAKYADSASRFVDLPGGFHVHYRDEGAPNQPVLVLLHGFGDSFTSWEGWVRELKDRFRIISLDFPGHGLTRAPQGYQLDGAGLADFVDTFATALALPKFAVAGNSMGGGAAWQLAVRHPDRIDALILVDAAGFPNEKPPTETPLAFKILQYPIGRAILRNIDNRSLRAHANLSRPYLGRGSSRTAKSGICRRSRYRSGPPRMRRPFWARRSCGRLKPRRRLSGMIVPCSATI
jgi:pimeloyl-ACP methyl ester carboxylesterase